MEMQVKFWVEISSQEEICVVSHAFVEDNGLNKDVIPMALYI